MWLCPLKIDCQNDHTYHEKEPTAQQTPVTTSKASPQTEANKSGSNEGGTQKFKKSAPTATLQGSKDSEPKGTKTNSSKTRVPKSGQGKQAVNKSVPSTVDKSLEKNSGGASQVVEINKDIEVGSNKEFNQQKKKKKHQVITLSMLILRFNHL